MDINTSILDTLSPAERELALSILKEYSEKGESKQLDNLYADDYEEMPVDILTFVDDYNYLGNAWHDAEGKSKLYPYWRDELVKIFPDPFTTTVNNAIFSGSRGRGKAQPLDSKIFTSLGYITMGEIQIGDKVFGDDGKLHSVLGIYPQGKKDVYEITFSDSSTVKCSDEHLWHVFDNDDQKWKTIELKDILGTQLTSKDIADDDLKYRYKIPLTDPLQFEYKETQIGPYQIGFLLGISCLPNDVKQPSLNKYKKELQNFELYADIEEEKFIPDLYLYNDINSRIALLQGLLDANGTVGDDRTGITFSSSNQTLSNQMKFLVQSLGGTAEVNLRLNDADIQNCQTRLHENCYIVTLNLPSSIAPFRIAEKLDRLNLNRPGPCRCIKDIKYIGKETCQCIYIDYDKHLYLTDNLIVTHNTEIAILIAAYLLHRILCLKNPIEYFHLKPTEKIVFAFMNIKLALAEEIGVAKFQNTLQSSPWFLSHGTIEGRTKKIWVPKKYNDQEAIDIKIGSQADDLIGLPIFFCFCLDGETEIKTASGIQKIKDLEGQQIQMYSIDNQGNEVLSDYCTIKPTGISKVEYDIELEDGTILKCTPNHRFMLKDGSYKEAKDLTEDDELFETN